ncbi:MAG: agmatine deiminase [Chitinophagales bacterium]|nr:MAG: agmatine deiminase [Chitinophagales bacterium]
MQPFSLTLPPRERGYYFPAEFHPHRATWLSWPHKEASWPGKIDAIYPVYARFVKLIAEGEKVCINVQDEKMKQFALKYLEQSEADLSQITFYYHPTNDAWCRDHGPAFLIHPQEKKKLVVDWGYNAWGGKYPPFDLDDNIPTRIAEVLGLEVVYPGIVMEGGSVDFNGAGTVLTTKSCLLNPNRNPHLSQKQIESYLKDYYGVQQVLWLEDGIAGDDTDGHIDDITRFVNADTVVTVIEDNRHDENYQPLKKNLDLLNAMRLADGRALNIEVLPMPRPVVYEGQRLPASYANFYICNKYVIVPTYRDDKHDTKALDVLARCFPDRIVTGLDSTDLIWGLGSFHCLSQQEPEII